MHLRVVKADGSIEQYFHTKVIGTIANALEGTGQPDIYVAEQLAQVVTYFLHRQQDRHVVASSEILSVIEVVLVATGYEDAAVVLSEHHFQRRLSRARIEVAPVDVKALSDAEALCNGGPPDGKSRWDKSRIVEDLVNKYNLSRQCARTVASMVEDKIFKMQMTVVPASLVKQLVLGDAAAVLRAEHQLEPA